MILIFSPQNWSHQFISKHHYAIAFSKYKKTFFFEPTTCKLGKYQIKMHQPYSENKNLTVVKISLPIPDIIRFKANSFFKRINARVIKHWIKKTNLKPEVMIDFGCHTSIANWSFIECKKKVYFPVDDFENLPIEKRGCNTFFSVSSNILEKFNTAGIPMKFMHHGLNHWFAEKAEHRLKAIENGTFKRSDEPFNIAYSGNLAIPFLDRELILHLVSTYQDCHFHFFGKNDSCELDYQKWFSQLKSFSNVYLYGQLSVDELAERLFKMDTMLLCYKPDNKNYHAENSHKINEYLSTGMPLISTQIKVINDKNFVYTINSDNTVLTHQNISSAIDESKKSEYSMMKARINYALSFSYYSNIQKII